MEDRGLITSVQPYCEAWDYISYAENQKMVKPTK